MQGYLEFDAVQDMDTILEELPDSYRTKHEALRHGLDLTFVYANPIPTLPNGATDYSPVTLASVPPGSNLRGAFLAATGGGYAAHGEQLRGMEGEGPGGCHKRWADLPHGVLARQPSWLVD